jgi:hypothetical protein
MLEPRYLGCYEVTRRRSDFGRAVSRILSSLLRAERIICLGSQYPEPTRPKAGLKRAASRSPIWPCTRWGFPCLRACAWSGGLLPHLFTLTGDSCEPPAVYFLWHFPSNDPAHESAGALPDVIRHTALRSSDFPLFCNSDRPAQLPTAYIIFDAAALPGGAGLLC